MHDFVQRDVFILHAPFFVAKHFRLHHLALRSRPLMMLQPYFQKKHALLRIFFVTIGIFYRVSGFSLIRASTQALARPPSPALKYEPVDREAH